ncbi:MAG: hypothetical protein ABW252_18620 [Polyangiales bacterium]
MSMLSKSIRAVALCAITVCAACGGDDDPKPASGPSIDAGAGTNTDRGPIGVVNPDAGIGAAPSANPLYLIGANVQTTDESTMYLWATKQFEGATLDLKKARELNGVGSVHVFNNYVYMPDAEQDTIRRFSVVGDDLQEGPSVSLANQGLEYLSYVDAFLSPERAFIVASNQFKIIEWNPTTMTITKTHDIAGFKREGWGNEFRGGFMRPDGKYFMYWAYTNERKDFLNTFVMGVWDAATGTLTLEEDPACPTTAGFGGYFDEQGDLYLIADSFGLFTQFGGFKDPKGACLLRVKKGETKLDPAFKMRPSEAMGGAFPWGFYYLGNGLAFTSGIDPATPAKYKSVFETLFAPEHEGWLLDTKNGTARKIQNLPKDGVGFESHTMDGRLFVPRTSGKVTIENIESTSSTLFEIKPDASATPVISLPGYIAPVLRVR